ncbi:MAG: YHS domain-containing protein [Candidatus Aminicenantes bacterium]
MSKKIVLLVVLFLVASVALVMAVEDKKEGEETLTCPVSGKEFTKSESTPEYEYEGRTYYFCCEGCKSAFVKDPARYTMKDAQTGPIVDSETTCGEEHAHAAEHAHAGHGDQHHHADLEKDGMAVDPVCGMKVNKEDAKFTHVFNDKTYYFCNEECKDTFIKAPGSYIRADEGIVTCPVSGESFKKSEFTESMDYEGTTYYFCCTGCKDKFEKNPEKYAKK